MSIEKYPQGEKMLKIDQFRARKTIIEDRDFDTADYIYYFNNLNGTSDEDISSARKEIYDHMIKFSQKTGIDEFSKCAFIFFER